MLTLLGKSHPFCDGMPRRDFLRIGGLAMAGALGGGLTLPALLKAEAAQAPGRRLGHKAVIMVFLAGGPPHLDMWDLKPDAPAEIRGPFRPIKTNVRGIEICELFPRLARISDKLVYLRSIVGAGGGHDAIQCLYGRKDIKGGWPCLGSVVSRLQGPANVAVPPALGLSPKTAHGPWGDNGMAGFLGARHAPFTPEGGDIQKDMVLGGVSLDRLRDRQGLLAGFDTFRRDVDAGQGMRGLDAYHEQAFGVLTSDRLAKALDITQEDQATRERYGEGSRAFVDDGPWRRLDQFLLARRLVEAGARCVTLAFSRWDWHGQNFKQAREHFPMLDQGVSALVEDLHARGLDKDVTVVVWGEFGRTPKINKDAGRDHWPNVNGGLLACGGMRTGQVVGSTEKDGGECRDRPIRFEEVHATIYHNLGIDPSEATIADLQGRPRHVIEPPHRPLREVL